MSNIFRDACRKPSDKHCRGGLTVLSGITVQELENKKKNLDVLRVLQQELADNGKFYEAQIVGRNFDRAKYELVKHGILYIEDTENGKRILASANRGMNPRMKATIRAIFSVIDGKPNELARAIFR